MKEVQLNQAGAKREWLVYGKGRSRLHLFYAWLEARSKSSSLEFSLPTLRRCLTLDATLFYMMNSVALAAPASCPTQVWQKERACLEPAYMQVLGQVLLVHICA